MTTVREVVDAAILRFNPEAPFGPASRIEAIGLDSMDRVELVMWLENRLGISLPDDAAEGTVAELVRAVEEAVGR